jgi:hypothetical protein
MKRSLGIVLITLLYLPLSAQKNVKMIAKGPGLPEFIKKDIEQYKAEDPKRWPVITRYKYKRKYVYYFRMPCCDQVNVVYDSKGRILGNPDGGFMGKPTDKPLPDFNARKKDPKKIWPEDNL